MKNINVREGEQIGFKVTLLPSEGVIGDKLLTVDWIGRVGGEACVRLAGEGECFNLQAARLERIGGKLVAAIPMRLRLERPGISGIGISITRVSNQI